MKKNERELEKYCRFCEMALELKNDPEHVLCDKKGVVSGEYSCRRFAYDPLKRRPAPPLHLTGDELSLDESDL